MARGFRRAPTGPTKTRPVNRGQRARRSSMQTESRAFCVAKDPEYESDYEDAWALDETLGRAAVADGVSSAIFSRQWAKLLTEGVVAAPPDVTAPAFWHWLAGLRDQWRQAIDVDKLGYFQRA